MLATQVGNAHPTDEFYYDLTRSPIAPLFKGGWGDLFCRSHTKNYYENCH
ncbi:MAG: hypothetical protein CLLPBCKN_008225 [Chroococcidiopsis cubana SAG 39.79]|nr:hypothetical protein [Chroococcidiopsis cubana SAG 39.79]